jgi:hypothetical protein
MLLLRGRQRKLEFSQMLSLLGVAIFAFPWKDTNTGGKI